MILKIGLGKGALGLLLYLSAPNKSPTTTHKNVPRLPQLHQPNSAINFGARVGKPTTSFGSLPALSGLNLVGGRQPGQVLLHQDAPDDLGRGGASDAREMRRPDHRSSPAGQGSARPFLTNMAGSTPQELGKQIGILRRLKPNLNKGVAHLILSHDPTQRELTETEWKEAIQIALQEHGADQAAMAAWRHNDTDHDHIHIFFCRVLPSGKVISDSHSYRKNETAARLIERTFMLDSPVPIPAESRPGDRQALSNTVRRAARKGTLDPTKIDAKAVRTALAEASNLTHFQRVLAEIADAESGFDRRGPNRQIYGWRLRRRGANEWIKASTLAKDLSWPKIAHRFAESDLTEQMCAQELIAPVAPLKMAADEDTEEVEDRYAPAPASARRIPRRTESPKEVAERGLRERQKSVWVPLIHRQEEKHALAAEVKQTMFAARSRLIKLLVNLAIDLAGVLADLANAVMAFLHRILAFFEFRVDEQRLLNQKQPPEARPALELFELKSEQQDDAETRLENAVLAVAQLTQAMRENDPSLLPPVDSTEKEALKTLMLQAKTAVSTDDFGPSTGNFESRKVKAQEQADASTIDPLVTLKKSGTEFFEAVYVVIEAGRKPDLGVKNAVQNLLAAEAELVAAKRELTEFKSKDKTLFRIWQTPQEAWVDKAEHQVKRAKAALEAAETRRAQAPMPSAPAPVFARLQAARAPFEADSLALVVSMKAQAAALANLKMQELAMQYASMVAAKLNMALRAHNLAVFWEAIRNAEAGRVEIAARQAEIERSAKLKDQHHADREAPSQDAEKPEIERPHG